MAQLPLGTIITPDQGLSRAYKKASSFYSTYDPLRAMSNFLVKVGAPGSRRQLGIINQNLARQQNLLTNLEPDVNKQTAGFDVNETQRREILASRATPLNTLIATLTNTKAAQEGDYAQRQALAESMLNAYNAKYGMRSKAYESNIDLAKLVQGQAFQEKQTKAQQAFEANQRALDRATRGGGGGGVSNADIRLLELQQAQLKDKKIQKAINNLASELDKVTGGDGYVSPQDYNKAKRTWSRRGYDPKSFDNFFAGYRNPQDDKYGVK